MARAIERIERDIAVLREAIGAIAAELESAYASYLSTLGQAVRRQLILASYYLCTQGYPEEFLSLSLNQRQQLQQAIRKLGQQAAEKLLSCVTSQGDEGNQGDVVPCGNDFVERLRSPTGDEGDEGDVVPCGNDFVERLRSPTGDEADEGDEGVISSLSTVNLDFSDPIELAKWQQNLEEATQEILKNLSHNANLLLQKAGMLPKKLPEPILAAAAAASEASAEVMPGPPNLLNLVIELENEQQPEDSGLTQIMAINLRLGEIEFADAALSSERKQIRNILVQLNKLGREYQQKQREHSVAEAEAAWRASWFED